MRNDPGTTTHAKQLTHSRLETPLPRVAPYLPLLAAVLLFVGSWLTWVTVRFAFVIDGAAQSAFDMPILGWSGLLGLIDQTPFIALARVSLFIWDVFPLTGIVLGLILLQRQRGSRARLVLYGGWLLITTPVVALILVRALTLTSPIPCAPGDPVCPETRML